jgi:hypothetical protein
VSLKTNISSLVTGVATEFNDSRTWAQTEFGDVYSTIQAVVDSIPTDTSDLTNNAKFIAGIGNITEIALRSYNDLQDLPSLNILNWDTAYAWGDHSLAGYATSDTTYSIISDTEADLGTHTSARTITGQKLNSWLNRAGRADWNTAFSWGDHSTQGYIKVEADPIFVASAAYNISGTDTTNWNDAYSWGNHNTQGYLTVEADPIFTASAAFDITTTKISNWDTAFSWGNHNTQGYLTSLPAHNHNDIYYTEAEMDTFLSNKVDKIVGYGLSESNFSSAEKTKLAGLESSRFKGTFISSSALNTAHPSPEEGAYAHVDAGAGQDVEMYIWDNDDSSWKVSYSNVTQETAASIKTKYESNPDTNVYDDLTKSKVDSLPASVESTSGAQTKANTAESNANTYTDTQISTHNHNGTYEPVLGNPSTDGQVVASTAAGERSWVSIPQPQVTTTDASSIQIWRGTQAQYDALTPDPDTLYFILE